MNKRKWYAERQNETTRSRSTRQEKTTAKQLRGYTTFNSGATLGQNDVITDTVEVECKTTSKNSFSLKTSDWELLKRKCHIDKIPIMTVEFPHLDKTLAVIDFADLKHLLKKA